MSKVQIERRGGFAGLTARATLEWKAMTVDQQRLLSEIFAKGGSPGPGAIRDGYEYRLTHEAGGAVRTVTLFSGEIPAFLEEAVHDVLP